jgi:protease IV
MAKKQDKIIVLSILALGLLSLIFLFFVLSGLNDDVSLSGSGDKVGIVELDGVITSSRAIVKQLEGFRKDDGIKAVVFRIDSPGGGIAASQEIFEHVRRVRESGKPVIASMGSVAASGGYYVALGADTIMANPGTTTGSIGVIAEFPNFTKLLDKLGVQMTVIKSGKFKDTGSPYRQMNEQDRQYLQAWIDDGYNQFVQAVAKERNMTPEHVRTLADGRVYSGEQALRLALIDTLGTYEDAIQLAAHAAGIKGEPRLIRQERRKLTPLEFLFSFDMKQFMESYFSAWPRIQYLMMF